MPLWLLGSIVVVGLAAIWIILRVYGFDRSMTLTHERAAAEFMADNPGLVPEDLFIAQSGGSALVRAGGELYVVWVMGLDVATHNLARARVRETGDGLMLHLRDFAAPRLTLALTPSETRDWRAMIEEAS